MHNNIPTQFTFISHFKKEKIINLNENVGIIFRNYENLICKKDIIELKKFCQKNKRKLFLANDLKTAVNLNLDGVYIPSFNKKLEFKKYNIKKNFIIMGSAHNQKEMFIKEKQGVQLIFLSPIFQTKKNKKKLGIIKFNILSKLTNKKIIALGGLNNINKK